MGKILAGWRKGHTPWEKRSLVKCEGLQLRRAMKGLVELALLAGHTVAVV